MIRQVGNLVPRVFCLALSLLGLAGCPGSLAFDVDGSTGGGGSGGLQTSCSTSSTVLLACTAACHNPDSKATFANLDLLSDGVAQRLVGVAADGSSLCNGKGNLLNRGTLPATGILIDKISATQTCGGAMPYGTPTGMTTMPADLACLKAWANGLVQSVGP